MFAVARDYGRASILNSKSFNFAMLAAVSLLRADGTRSALAQSYSATILGGLPGSTSSSASGINNCGQVVGVSEVGGSYYATEWSGGKIINLGGLPGSTYSSASGINNAGQVVGVSEVGGSYYATEWSGGKIINLGGLPGRKDSFANA